MDRGYERQDSRITQDFYLEQLVGRWSSHLLIGETLQKEQVWGVREGVQYQLRYLSYIDVDISRKKLNTQVQKRSEPEHKLEIIRYG